MVPLVGGNAVVSSTERETGLALDVGISPALDFAQSPFVRRWRFRGAGERGRGRERESLKSLFSQRNKAVSASVVSSEGLGRRRMVRVLAEAASR